MPTYTIGPIPTPNPPSGVNYTPQAPGGTIYSQPTGADLWNTAWNTGYNQANSTSNPYSGQTVSGYDIGSAYTQGQQQYLKDRPTNNTTNNTSTNNNVTTNTNTGTPSGGTNVSSGPSPEQLAAERVRQEQEALRGQISGGYDNYFSQLDSILNNDLPTQYGNNSQIIENSYGQGLTDLDSQNRIGQNELLGQRNQVTTQQNKSLKDVAENVRQMFQTGQNLLGSRGAGDSSAANQYSYALTKLGTKARTQVMGQASTSMDQIRQREFKLSETYNTEKSRLATEKNNKILEVSNWFASEQSKLRQAKASGELSKSTDLANLSRSLLDQALSALNTANADILNKNSMLDQWAINNSKNIAQLKSNFSGISSYKAPTINSPYFSGTPSFSGGGFNVPINWSNTYNSDDEDNNLG